MTVPTIACLGPRGSHSEAAARRLFPDSRLVLYPNISGAIEAATAGQEGLCVVPIENALEGSINITLDSISGGGGMLIVRELVWPIRHHLAALDMNVPPRVILSHPQALAQCRDNLKLNYPGVQTKETGSTSEAAVLAAQDKESAALCSGEAAHLYGLTLLREDMQDTSINCTRFVALCPGVFKQAEENAVKTSIACELDGSRAGTLCELLKSFADRQINLVRIESRPTRRVLGRYIFFLDLEGSIASPIVQAALDEVRDNTLRLEILGSYPVLTV